MQDPRLKIAFVVDRFGNRYGGAEAYGVELMRELAREHNITVFARDYDPGCDLKLPFVSLRSWSHWPSWIRVLIFACRAGMLTSRGYDIVHSHMNGWCGDIDVVHVTPVRYNWRVRPMGRVKRLLSYTSLRVHTYLGLEARRVAPRRAHRTVAVSGLIAEQLRQAYGTDLSYPIIPPGVTLPASADAQARTDLRREFGWSDDHCVCLLVARNPLRKGLPTVLKALEKLPARYQLLVVGGNAGMRELIFKTLGYQALADRVRWVEETSDVSPYYGVADIYVHPTLNDSFGMAPLEAMSFSLPVILSPGPWCGFAQYVRDGHDAMLLSHPENAEQLAGFIQKIDEDQVCRAQLVLGSRQLVASHCWSEIAARYLDLYAQVIVEREPALVPGKA
jgi:UDP-glucose:(heptosyl)LPS alpha-1,3-glucosyltransferase